MTFLLFFSSAAPSISN